MNYRALLFAAASAATLYAGAAAAQAQPATINSEVEELVVTGTRTEGRSRLDTLAPVDVISNEAITRQGTSTELAQALSNLTPAIDFPRPAITDGTDHVRPATLRGLAPDQTLVLVNGMRGHVSALVAVNGSIGRGSTSFDLNTIPTVAVERVEILRDGASAQYGADAIAGVLNIRLREAREGGGVTASYGIHKTKVATSRGSRDANDGLQESVSAWQGLPIGEEGFLTISGEYALRHATNRSDFANPTALPNYGRPIILGRYGDPYVRSWSLYGNAGMPLNETWELFGYAGYQHRDTSAAATARAYNNANNVAALTPGGFLPRIDTDIDDWNVQGGVRGEMMGWRTELGVSYGRNDLEYYTVNSVNASFGAASKRDFYAGSLGYGQFLVNLNLSRPFEVGLVKPLNVAVGLEHRREAFEIGAGEPASYTVGPITSAAGVSQGFPGFRPANEVDVDRNNWSAYVDLEGNLTEAFSFDVAARFEDYSDFGSKTTGKVAARYDFSPEFALRGSVSTGFKAPALQQRFFTYTSTNNVLVGSSFQLIEIGTFPVAHPVAVALGAKPLEPETSTNYAIGAVWRTGPLEVTVDAYHIDLENRIVLSENLPNSNTPAATTAVINAILAPFGVSGARFFINGVDTTTRGVDIVARYRMEALGGRVDLTAAGNFNRTEVTKIPALPSITSLPQPAFVFDRGNRLTFEEGTPDMKLVLQADYTAGPFGLTAKGTHYASVLVPNNNPTFDYQTGEATLLDLEARWEFDMGVRLAVGVNNLTDEYPNFTPGNINSPTGSIGFPGYSPFGFNGRFWYARIGYNW
ncbi:TonB-dependent receptor [Phenylobacterium sp.]|jgi:iron complex outermembrane receptor protein|uniref:TonB-dependent receptor plug domain-containing protein n=1 Tax=Phenylobacterium sp. TaxID=1871053 RepID=UPI002F91CF6D